MKSSSIFGIIIAVVGGYLVYKYYIQPQSQTASTVQTSKSSFGTPTESSGTTTVSSSGKVSTTSVSKISASSLGLTNNSGTFLKVGNYIVPTTSTHVSGYTKPVSSIVATHTGSGIESGQSLRGGVSSGLGKLYEPPPSSSQVHTSSIASKFMNTKNVVASARFPAYDKPASVVSSSNTSSTSQVHVSSPYTLVQHGRSPYANRFIA